MRIIVTSDTSSLSTAIPPVHSSNIPTVILGCLVCMYLHPVTRISHTTRHLSRLSFSDSGASITIVSFPINTSTIIIDRVDERERTMKSWSTMGKRKNSINDTLRWCIQFIEQKSHRWADILQHQQLGQQHGRKLYIGVLNCVKWMRVRLLIFLFWQKGQELLLIHHQYQHMCH